MKEAKSKVCIVRDAYIWRLKAVEGKSRVLNIQSANEVKKEIEERRKVYVLKSEEGVDDAEKELTLSI